MATPNIINVATITPKVAVGAVTTSRADTAPTATFGVIVATLIIFGVAIYFYLSIQILLP